MAESCGHTEGEKGRTAHGPFITQTAKPFAGEKTNLRLIAGEQGLGLILIYYERPNLTHQGLLPPKQVFITQRSP